MCGTCMQSIWECRSRAATTVDELMIILGLMAPQSRAHVRSYLLQFLKPAIEHSTIFGFCRSLYGTCVSVKAANALHTTECAIASTERWQISRQAAGKGVASGAMTRALLLKPALLMRRVSMTLICWRRLAKYCSL